MARRFYAVQNGAHDNDCSYGSTNKRTAYQIARGLHKQYPDDEVRIVVCTTDDVDEPEEIIIVYEGYNDDEEIREHKIKSWGWKQ